MTFFNYLLLKDATGQLGQWSLTEVSEQISLITETHHHKTEE